MKKAQAALEFLMTYGWAFLVILIMIATLAYFGVLSPKNLLGERCTAPSGFTCEEFNVGSNRVELVLRNNLGETIDIADGTVSNVGVMTVDGLDITGVTTTVSGGSNVVSGDSVYIVVQHNQGIPQGEKYSFELSIPYTPVGGQIAKYAKVTVFAESQLS